MELLLISIICIHNNCITSNINYITVPYYDTGIFFTLARISTVYFSELYMFDIWNNNLQSFNREKMKHRYQSFTRIGRQFKSLERQVYADWTSVSFPFCQRSCLISKSRYYKERQVDRKSASRFVGDSSAFVMGAMFLASALNRGIPPRKY